MLTTFLIEIEIQEDVLKKNEVYNGIVTRLHFPNKGYVQVEGEEKSVMVKNTLPGQTVSSVSYTHLTLPTIA